MGLFADLSLRQKLTLISMVPAAAGLLIFLSASLLNDRQTYRTMLENDLARAASMLAFNSTALLKIANDHDGVRLLEAASVYSDVDYACIFDRDGRLFAEYLRPGTRRSGPPVVPRAPGTYADPGGMALFYSVEPEGDPLGTIYLHSTLESYRDLFNNKLMTIGILLLVAGTLTAVLALRIQRLIYDPIVQLAGAARTITRTNDYSLRVVRQSNDELGDLVEQFNRMLNRVQDKNNALKSEIVVRQAAEQQIAAANEELRFEIGQRTQAEEQLGVLLENLEAKNEELQNFAHVVSHDLKAPLRGINSLASWLAKDYGALLDEKGLRYLDQLRERSRRMHTLIEGVLRYSRLGRASISPERLDTHALARQVIELLSPPELVRVTIEGRLPPVYYDRIMLLQVFQNLIGNAIQHLGKPAGTVTVACRISGTDWEFSVRDDGVGIEARHFDRIFRIFQSPKAGKDSETSGIGLALVKKIIERNHGRITVESVPGEGATFCFTVPIRSEFLDRFGPLDMLIVDANVDYANVTRKLLENFGHHVTTVTRWDSAESALARNAVRLDMILWDPDNLEVSRETMLTAMQQHHPEALIVVCRTKGNLDPISPGSFPGLAGTICKPLTVEKLNAILTFSTLDGGDSGNGA